MNSRLLIDAIVRQTTVLIAQLSTAAGIRAPLSHVADEVFVSLAKELEAQGVGRKVAADMFGLALRTYQKKVQRLAESATEQERTLWEAVLDFVSKTGSVSRREVLERFSRDGEREVVAVLTDLVGSGLVHAAGRGATAVYGITTDVERRALIAASETESPPSFVWAALRSSPGMTREDLAQSLRVDASKIRDAVSLLVAEGRLQTSDDTEFAFLRAAPLMIPVGAEQGWEVAVMDHFRAVANAIASKVRNGRTGSAPNDVVGGTTLSFKVFPGHPLSDRVHGLLARVRADAIALWNEVEAHNAATPPPDAEATLVWFYLGQYLESLKIEEAP